MKKGRTREKLDEMGLSSKEAVARWGDGRWIEFKVKNERGTSVERARRDKVGNERIEGLIRIRGK